MPRKPTTTTAERVEETPPPMLTGHEVAALLKVPYGTIKRWSAEGYIPVHKLGRLNRYSVAEIEAWVEAKAATPPKPTKPQRRRSR